MSGRDKTEILKILGGIKFLMSKKKKKKVKLLVTCFFFGHARNILPACLNALKNTVHNNYFLDL